MMPEGSSYHHGWIKTTREGCQVFITRDTWRMEEERKRMNEEENKNYHNYKYKLYKNYYHILSFLHSFIYSIISTFILLLFINKVSILSSHFLSAPPPSFALQNQKRQPFPVLCHILPIFLSHSLFRFSTNSVLLSFKRERERERERASLSFTRLINIQKS